MKRMSSTPITVLNANQQRAVENGAYPSCLQAGAGSGKTYVMVDKIIHILMAEPETSLENFAVVTFTNKAADELAARLQSALYRVWIDNMNSEYAGKLFSQISVCNMADVSTIHSFCEKLLRRYGALTGIPNTFSIKSYRQETREIVTRHINRFKDCDAFREISQFKILDLVTELLYSNGGKGLSIDEKLAGEFVFDTPDNELFNRFKKVFVEIYSRSETEITQKKARENIMTANDHRALTQSEAGADFDVFLEMLDSAFKAYTVENILSVIYEKSHAIEYLRNKKQYQAAANLLKLKEKARELTRNEMIKPLQFLEYLNAMISSGKDEDEAELSDEDRKLGVVSLYSVHKAKGLEFPVVIIPNCDMTINRKSILPKIIYEPEQRRLAVHSSIMERNSGAADKEYDELFRGKLRSNLEEELRIFYVGCTRAKNMLVLSCNGSIERVEAGRTQNASWINWVLASKIMKPKQPPGKNL